MVTRGMGELQKRIGFYRRQTKLTRKNLNLSEKEKQFAYEILDAMLVDVGEMREGYVTYDRALRICNLMKGTKDLPPKEKIIWAINYAHSKNTDWFEKWLGDGEE